MLTTVTSHDISTSEDSEDYHDLTDCEEPELCFDIHSKGSHSFPYKQTNFRLYILILAILNTFSDNYIWELVYSIYSWKWSTKSVSVLSALVKLNLFSTNLIKKEKLLVIKGYYCTPKTSNSLNNLSQQYLYWSYCKNIFTRTHIKANAGSILTKEVDIVGFDKIFVYFMTVGLPI